MPQPRELPQMTPVQALVRGVVTCLVLFVPAALINLVATSAESGDSNPALTALFYLIFLLGAGAGGWATIRLSNEAPLAYSSAAPAVAYVVVQGVGIIRRLVADDAINWGAYPFLMLLVATCGMLGGMFARRLMNQGES